MTEVNLEKGISIRNLHKVFEEQIKPADYTDDVVVKMPEGFQPDLAGVQVLISMKKTAAKNGKTVSFEGIAESCRKFL